MYFSIFFYTCCIFYSTIICSKIFVFLRLERLDVDEMVRYAHDVTTSSMQQFVAIHTESMQQYVLYCVTI